MSWVISDFSLFAGGWIRIQRVVLLTCASHRRLEMGGCREMRLYIQALLIGVAAGGFLAVVKLLLDLLPLMIG